MPQHTDHFVGPWVQQVPCSSGSLLRLTLPGLFFSQIISGITLFYLIMPINSRINYYLLNDAFTYHPLLNCNPITSEIVSSPPYALLYFVHYHLSPFYILCIFIYSLFIICLSSSKCTLQAQAFLCAKFLLYPQFPTEWLAYSDQSISWRIVKVK